MSSISLESMREFNAVDFRAPPPSPVAAGRRSTIANDDVLSQFLEHSLRVPDLVLPDRVFPRQKIIQNPPILDFQSLNSAKSESILESIGQIGCFEILNHGIPSDIIRSVLNSGSEIFQLSAEKKAIVSRCSERAYGFVDFGGKEERETSEEFVWCREESLRSEMERVWPIGYSNFRYKMERLLLSEIEKVGAKIILALEQKLKRKWRYDEQKEVVGSICYLYKHCSTHHLNIYEEMIRMVIRGSEQSHALCFHICDGSSEFHVYSKKGWVCFCPLKKNALVVTIGDQLQAWSGGQYKHVIGRPIFNQEEDCKISMAFLYSPHPPLPLELVGDDTHTLGRTISLGQQAIFALLLPLFYPLFIYIYQKLG